MSGDGADMTGGGAGRRVGWASATGMMSRGSMVSNGD
jgi:hypothetical protein